MAIALIKDPMFTEGQIGFALIFFIAFVVIVALMYRKDKKLHQRNYKGVVWILLGFISFIVLLVLIKFGLQS
ncbi:hypothetical protein [Nonlabens xiamenensis]|uniref:hypothetical protein n=1 Tax=Nonlabens xiamenensis TaxID=2341043 RepID=UPI002938E286|nr:hypothetical protein [Nonlabens xiamenensis]